MLPARAPGPVLALVLTVGCSPTPLHVVPAQGSMTGGQPVRLEGVPLDAQGEPILLTGHGPLGLYFGRRAAIGVVIEGDTLIGAVTPKREEAGPVDVRLQFGDGLVLTLEGGFEYRDSPGIILTPDIAP